jgi:hypothetical protein
MNWETMNSHAESPSPSHLIVGGRIAFFVVLMAMTVATLASGCAVGYTATVADDGYGPDLVEAGPGVQVVADYDEPVFFSEGVYWRFSSGYWYRSPYYNRGWVSARPPMAVMHIQHPQTYAHYRPAGWAPRGRAVPPPGVRHDEHGRYEAHGAPPPRPMYQAAPPPRAQPQGWRAPPPAAAPAPAPRAQPPGWRGAPAPHGAPPPNHGGGEHHDHR